MAESSVVIDELFRVAGQLPWPEALAAVQALIHARAGDPAQARLCADGHVVAEPGPLPTVLALAQLLQKLLPPPGTPSDPRVPAALRYSLIRATGGVTAPPFVSVEDFSRTLARFEQGDRQQRLRSLFARWGTVATRQTANPADAGSHVRSSSESPVTRQAPARDAHVSLGAHGPSPSVLPAGSPESRVPARPQVSRPAVAWDSWPLEGRAATTDRQGAVSVPREKGRSAVAARHEAVSVRHEEPRRVMTAAPPARPARKRAGPVLTTVVALSLLVAAGVAAAAVFVYADDRPPSAIFAAIGPEVNRAKEWIADLRAAVGKERAAGPARRSPEGEGGTPAPPQQPPDSPAVPARPSPEGERGTPAPRQQVPLQGEQGAASGTAGRDATPPPETETGTLPSVAPVPDGPSLDPDRPNSLPGQLVVALDLGRKPVFSPSFASDGTAVFYDEDSGAAGSALKEARTGSDRLLHVLSVLDDGARNYHPQLSPDGTTVAFDSDRDGTRGVYLSNRAGADIRRVSGDGYAAVPSWSPDGRHLAFIKAEPDNPRVWNVWMLDVPDGAMRRLTNHRVGQPWGASWFPDGRRICYSHEDRLIVLDTQSGASHVYPSPRKGVLVRTPAVSPDGRRVIFQLYRHGGWVLDLDDGSMRQVLDDPSAEEFAWSPDGSRVAFHSRREKQWGIRVMDSPNSSPSR